MRRTRWSLSLADLIHRMPSLYTWRSPMIRSTIKTVRSRRPWGTTRIYCKPQILTPICSRREGEHTWTRLWRKSHWPWMIERLLKPSANTFWIWNQWSGKSQSARQTTRVLLRSRWKTIRKCSNLSKQRVLKRNLKRTRKQVLLIKIKSCDL